MERIIVHCFLASVVRDMRHRIMTFLYRFFISILCILALPILIGIALAVRIFSGMPVLFQQKRVGKNGKIFTMYKFRTMVVRAEKQQEN